MMMLLALAFVLQDQDAYQIPQQQEQPPATQQVAPADKQARRDLQKRIARAGELYETLGRCTGSMTIEEVQALLAGIRDTGPAGTYLTGRFEAGLRKPRDDDGWCHSAVNKLSAG